MHGRTTTSTLQAKWQEDLAPGISTRATIIPKEITEKDFELGEFLQAGSYSEVFKGKFAGQEVAIKRVHKHMRPDKYFTSQQIHIMQELQRLNAPHVIPLLAYTVAELNYYLVMPLMPHDTLGKHIFDEDQQPFSTTLCYEILIAIARAVNWMHANLILHCDIKSANVLLDANMRAHLADFDAAVKVDPHTQRCAIDSNCSRRGTLFYLAPEIIQRKHYSTASDVFAYTILVWETLAWRLYGESLSELEEKEHIFAKIENGYRDEIPDTMPTNMASLIRNGWHHDEKERPSMQTMHDELVQHENKMKL